MKIICAQGVFNSTIKSSEQGDFQIYKLLVGHKAYPTKYKIEGGQLKNLSIIDADRINVTIDATSSGQIILQIPKNLISRQISSFFDSFDKISNKETDFPDLRTFSFDSKKGKQSLEIEGIIHVPDFLSKSISEKNSDENKPDVIPISSTPNQDNLTNWTVEDIPKIMWLEDLGFSNYNLSLRSIINNGGFTVKEGIGSTTSKVTNWNPSLIFEFPKQEHGNTSIFSQLNSDMYDNVKNGKR